MTMEMVDSTAKVEHHIGLVNINAIKVLTFGDTVYLKSFIILEGWESVDENDLLSIDTFFLNDLVSVNIKD